MWKRLSRLGLLLVFKFLILGMIVPQNTLQAAPQVIIPPQKLAIYYGWPSLVNGAAGDVSVASAEFSHFDIVVLGDGIEHPTHGDHAATAQIITNLTAGGTQTFGYIDMGIITQNLSIATAQSYVDEWLAMGVDGIFWDDVGYDYGVDRARQKTLIDYTHTQGLLAFANAWVPADIFDTDGGVPTPLQTGDWYLAESHPVADGNFADLSGWWTKTQALTTYQSITGVKMGAIATGVVSNTGWANRPQYRQSLWAAYLGGMDSFGFTTIHYSSSDNFLVIPPTNATNIGNSYSGNAIQINATTFHRTTDSGVIEVSGDATDGYGTFYGGTCDVESISPVPGTPLSAVWPDCTLNPTPHSSPYGPRQKASEAYRYDWHRGVDMPQPLGDPVYAMRDGVVRIAGSNPNYSDPLIQIRHRGLAPYLYTNVLHMDSVVVNEGDLVTVGDLVGYSGASVSGFEHMHMEYRDGCLFQRCNRNPWRYLNYVDTAPPQPVLKGANLGVSQSLLLMDVTTADDQLDFDGVKLTWNGTYTASFEAINATTDTNFPAGLDHPVQPLGGGVDVCMFPEQFNTSAVSAEYRFAFSGLATGSTGSVAGLDVQSTGAPAALSPVAKTATLTPLTHSISATPGISVTLAHTLQNNSAAAMNVTISAQSAQNNPLSLNQTALNLAAGQSASLLITVGLSPDFPVGVGDCVLLEISDGSSQTLIAVDHIGTTGAPTAVTNSAIAVDSNSLNTAFILILAIVAISWFVVRRLRLKWGG